MATHAQLQAVLHTLSTNSITVTQFFLSLLESSSYHYESHVNDLTEPEHTVDILTAFLCNPKSSLSTHSWAIQLLRPAKGKAIASKY